MDKPSTRQTDNPASNLLLPSSTETHQLKMPKYTKARTAQLNATCKEKFIIEASESESESSWDEFSDIFSDFDSDSDSDLEAEAPPPPKPVDNNHPPEAASPLAPLLHAHSTARRSSLAAAESAILDYLHANPVTPADVDLLVPGFNRVFAVTNKLATNIALFHARGRISSAEKEEMLVRLLWEGDERAVVFERAKERIERFAAEAEKRRAANERGMMARLARKGVLGAEVKRGARVLGTEREGGLGLLQARPALPSAFSAPVEMLVVRLPCYSPARCGGSSVSDVDWKGTVEYGVWCRSKSVPTHLFRPRGKITSIAICLPRPIDGVCRPRLGATRASSAVRLVPFPVASY
ncbi:hypothetical protein K505DRAFT_366046 [Melanomma pulvis-pyrius CBS 109.77]|uniref:Uncharacterized protein n=1 Tax=Melanomma pulvis-pyrius CBS 109.77 TaxID=1314802 RepID=A0A6A6WXW6_9PLEO|nr:hypothetical protein K505DRAFT_366046 [Melanomma pulvis-pyrius CBS 109.77]